MGADSPEVSSFDASLATDVIESLDETATTGSSTELVAEGADDDVVPSRSDFVSSANCSLESGDGLVLIPSGPRRVDELDVLSTLSGRVSGAELAQPRIPNGAARISALIVRDTISGRRICAQNSMDHPTQLLDG
jgi:hypothetical protein